MMCTVLPPLRSVSTGKSSSGRGGKPRIGLFVTWARKFAGGMMKEASSFV